jgi:hypothetical protein
LIASIFVAVAVVPAELWSEHAFNAMTPAQHLAEAKNVLEKIDSDNKNEFSWDEGLAHARAADPANTSQKSISTKAEVMRHMYCT